VDQSLPAESTRKATTVNADGSLTKFAAYAGLPGTFAGAAAY